MTGPAQLAGFGLGRCFEVFKVSAFRLETLSTYAVPAGKPAGFPAGIAPAGALGKDKLMAAAHRRHHGGGQIMAPGPGAWPSAV